ncbi:MAG: GNAT family N-acetyltransferase [Candidatus Nanoarchaeia archaeon]
MKIRKATKKDVMGIVELYWLEFRKVPYNERDSKREILRKIVNYFKGNVIFVLEIGGKVEGFIIGQVFPSDEVKSGFIDEIVISSNFQGKGFGKKLIEEIDKYFMKNGARIVELLSHRRSKAFKIYKKMGFKEEKGYAYMRKELK